MTHDHRSKLSAVKDFRALVRYLRDEMHWPIALDSFEQVDDLVFDFTPEELGIDPKTAAKILEIKRLRPLSAQQPWGIFYVKFEPKRLPVVALRRILGQVAIKKRASANRAERTAWAADDLLFISNYGEGDERTITFAHFARAHADGDLPTLKVLGWDARDTHLHLDDIARQLTTTLAWPEDEADTEAWRARWRSSFTLGHRETITTSKALAIALAALARDIRDRITTALAIETDKGPLTKLMKAFQEALVHDLDADGFADMYAQTIAYGLLSARIAAPHKKTADDFAAHMRTNPFLRELMETFLKVGGRRGKAGGPGIDFDELGVSEVVELLDDANMEAVVRDFGDRNPQEDPVIHFYELFLKEYDARKRMQRGVFYTPRPVVSYIVRSVDELLRTEFGLADGLADTTTWGEIAKRHKDLKIPEGVSPDQDFVQILDPATGTGTFLVEVIDLIHKTLVAEWKALGHGEKKIDALWNEYVPKHLLTRLHGYELLMAPYAIAHLKIGLKLYETGYRFGSDERARVYLTNALEPAHDVSGRFEFAIPALAHEAAAVNEIKRRRRFTAVIGNPPYSNFGQLNKNAFILGLLAEYKRGLEEKKLNLDDDYLKFWRFAQYLLSSTGCGGVGLITNSSYLDGLVHRQMRGSFLTQFPVGFIVDLHGNSRRGDLAPDGSADENVFDIQQGVAIAIWGMRPERDRRCVQYLELWGDRESKYRALGQATIYSNEAIELEVRPPQSFLVRQSGAMRDEYEPWLPLAEVFAVIGSGLNTDRDELCIDFDRAILLERMQRVFAGGWDAQFVEQYNLRPSSSYDPVALAKRQSFDPKALHTCVYRPFDIRSIYYKVGFTSRPVFEVQSHMLRPNLGLLVCRQSKEPFAVLATRHITTHKIVAVYDRTSIAPLWIYHDIQGGQRALGGERARSASFGPGFVKTLAKKLRSPDGDRDLPTSLLPEDVFHYVYGVFYSPSYRSRYAEFLKIDFPRLPLTGNLELFRALARLGGELTALHLLESPRLAKAITELVGGRNPDVEKVSWSKNTVWIDKAQTTGFKGVREDVWNFHIGGYQVCEKWLKDRKGRTLSKDDIAHYQKIVVALAETIRLMKEIDEVIEQHGGWPGAFASPPQGSATETPARRVAEPPAEYGPGSPS